MKRHHIHQAPSGLLGDAHRLSLANLSSDSDAEWQAGLFNFLQSLCGPDDEPGKLMINSKQSKTIKNN